MNFRSGERVVHEDRPEWGVGVVLSAQPEAEGHRVRVRFERAGLKTLVSPPAAIRPEAASNGHAKPAADKLQGLDDEAAARVMTSLPEATYDPFTNLQARLAATLNLYKYEPTGASLIDWAAVQSGLADPMSRFNRHELEVLFRGFERERDAHLKKFAEEVRKMPSAALTEVLEKAPAAGRRALSRFIGR